MNCCLWCGKPSKPDKRFCGAQCASLAQHHPGKNEATYIAPPVSKKCPKCGYMFYKKAHESITNFERRVYCSRDCSVANIGRRVNRSATSNPNTLWRTLDPASSEFAALKSFYEAKERR